MIFQPTKTSRSFATRENCQKFIKSQDPVGNIGMWFVHIGEDGRFYPVVLLNNDMSHYMRATAEKGIYTLCR